MTSSRTRRFMTGPRAIGMLVVAGGLVIGGSAVAYADGSPSPTGSGTPSAASGSTAPQAHSANGLGAPHPPKVSGSEAPKARPGAPQRGRGPGGGPGGGRPPAPAVTGTLTAVNGSTLTVRSDSGTSYTVTLKSGATIHEGPQPISSSKLTPGERVAISGSVSSTSLTATSVDVRRAHIDGTVTAVSGSTVTVVGVDGFTRTVDISGVSDAAVSVGERVHAEGTVASNGTTLTASTIGTPKTPTVSRGN